MGLRRLADPQVSPDGAQVAFVLTEVDLAANAKRADVWMVPTAGGTARRLTWGAVSSAHPRWSPEGRRLAFISARNGQAQVLNSFGEPIPGLYAAGRNACGVSAQQYPGSGVSVADGLVFGRIAGKNVAALEGWS